MRPLAGALPRLRGALAQARRSARRDLSATAAAGPAPAPAPAPAPLSSYVLGGRAAYERRAAVDEMLRVDQAGEAAAVKIYAGQLFVLGARARVAGELSRMRAGEEQHLRAINALVAARRARPTLLLPAWRAAGFALGAATALLGPAAAMACTVAVETAISEHYNAQLRELLRRGMDRAAEDAALARTLSTHRDEELEHHDAALRLGAEQAPFYRALTGAIRAGCAAAIAVARRV